MARGPDWTKEQDELTVAAYFAMWSRVRAGERINKRQLYRDLGATIGRPYKAVELKFQNISAVLRDLGGTGWAGGLMPRGNYQELLADSVLEWLELHDAWLKDLIVGVEDEGDAVAHAPMGAHIEVDPPRGDAPLVRSLAKIVYGRTPKVLDFIEINQRNQRLGSQGEEFVVEYERRRLHDVVKSPRLSKRVEWVSRTQGDGLGYDIASFNDDGSPRLIEVKTTTLGMCTPFFLSRNEVAVSKREERAYQLYRLFEFAKQPKFYRLRGPLEDCCHLDSRTFTARAIGAG